MTLNNTSAALGNLHTVIPAQSITYGLLYIFFLSTAPAFVVFISIRENKEEKKSEIALSPTVTTMHLSLARKGTFKRQTESKVGRFLSQHNLDV